MPFFLSQLYGLCMFSAYVTDKMHVSRLRSKNAIAPYWVAQSNMILLKTKTTPRKCSCSRSKVREHNCNVQSNLSEEANER
jgi:hypothetical protein